MANIVLISHSAEMSGATLVLLWLARFLTAKGHDVSVIFPGEVEQRLTRVDLRQLKKIIIPNPEVSFKETISLSEKVKILGRRLRYVNEVRRQIKQSQADLVYVNTAMAIYGAVGGKLAGKKILWHINEDLGLNKWNRLRIALIKRLSTGVIFATPQIARNFGKPPERQQWFFVPNPVEVEKFMVSAEEALACRKEHNIPQNVPVLLTIGFVSRRKGIDVLLRAFARIIKDFPSARLLVVGPYTKTPPVYWNKLQQIIADGQLEKNVIFTGFRDDVPGLLVMSDIFVLPSRNEAMPICLLEAMAAGKPIIATRVDAVEDILEGERLGIIVPPENESLLAEAIINLLRNKARGKEMGKLARDKALKEYSADKILPQIEQIILKFI